MASNFHIILIIYSNKNWSHPSTADVRLYGGLVEKGGVGEVEDKG